MFRVRSGIRAPHPHACAVRDARGRRAGPDLASTDAPDLTPLAGDVDFRALAETYEVSGGDIRNAVLKAAMAAASEPGSDALKAIHHRHLEAGIQDVLAGKRVMQQSLFKTEKRTRPPGTALSTLIGITALLVALAALIIALLR